MPSYKTVKKEASDEFCEKRSRFIGYVRPVTTVDGANKFISEIKQKHWDAKHNVYAYVLRERNLKKYSDDGEPQGTAGVPVLDVIEKSGVSDVCVVVTRYFGGILLGGGGLVRAYSHAAKIALDAGEVVTMELSSVLSVSTDYNFYGRLTPLIAENGGTVESTEFSDKVGVSFCISCEKEEYIKSKIFDLSNGKVSAKKTGEKYIISEFKEN